MAKTAHAGYPERRIEYSPYIGRDLMLARRARTPRVLFIDDQVLDVYKRAFPLTAVPFFREAPETELSRHVEAISQFRRDLASGGAKPPREYVAHQVTVITDQGCVMRRATRRRSSEINV
jgi:hypothetical protein